MKQSVGGGGGGESGNICDGNNNFTQELKKILKSIQYKKFFRWSFLYEGGGLVSLKLFQLYIICMFI